jgi:hypothetical protein
MNETLHGFSIRDGKIVIAVTSNGCTEPTHFRLDVADTGGELAVTVVRMQPDSCKMVAHIVEIELDLPDSLKSAAFKPFRLQNLFITRAL